MTAAARYRRVPFIDQHRRGAGGIEDEEILAPLPDPLLRETSPAGRIRQARAARSANAGRKDDGTASACACAKHTVGMARSQCGPVL